MNLARTRPAGALPNLRYLDVGLVSIATAAAVFLIYLSPIVAVGTILGAAAVVYFSNRVHHLLYFLIIYLPLEEFVLKWVDYSIYPALRYGIELIIYLVLVKVISGKLAGNRRLASSPIDLPLLCLALLGIISCLLNNLPILSGLLGLRPLLRYAAIFYLILNSEFFPLRLEKLFKTIFLIAFLEVVVGLAQYLIGDPANLFLRPKDSLLGDRLVSAWSATQDIFAGQKIFATMGRYNLLGGFLAVVLLILFAIRFERGYWSFKEKFLLFSTIPVFLLTYSRLSWVGFLAGLITLFFIKKKSKLILALGLIGAVAVVTLSSGTTSLSQSEVRGSIIDRVTGPFTADYWHATTSVERVYAASELLSNLSGVNLVAGFGPGSMGSLVANIDERISQLYRVGDAKRLLIVGDVGWAALLGQLGIIGLGLFVWLLVALFKNSLKNYRSSTGVWNRSFSLALCCYILAMVAMNFFSSPFETRVNSAYFWIISGVVLKKYEESKNQ